MPSTEEGKELSWKYLRFRTNNVNQDQITDAWNAVEIKKYRE